MTWHPNQFSTIMLGLEYSRSAHTEIPAIVVSDTASGGLTDIPLRMQVISAAIGASYAFDE